MTIKPGRAVLSPTLVAPEYRGLWTDLSQAWMCGDGLRSEAYTRFGKGITVPGSATEEGVGPAGMWVHGSGVHQGRSANNRITLPASVGVKGNDAPTPPATFSFLISDLMDEATVNHYWTVASWGGVYYSGGYTPWVITVYGRLASLDHRMAIMSRDGATLAGDFGSEMTTESGNWLNSPTPRMVTVVWDGNDLISWYIDGIFQTSSTAATTWQSGGTQTNQMRLLGSKEASSVEWDFPGNLYSFYSWDRELGTGEIVQLAADPFGMFRMDLSGPEVWAAGTTVTLTPNGDGTVTGIFNEVGATTGLYVSVDDDPDSPTTTDWVSSGEADGNTFFQLSATPTDFSGMSSLSVRADVASVNFETDTVTLYAQVFAANESTTYTDEVSVATQVSSGLVTADFALDADGIAASKADWDVARLRLRWDYTG